MKLNFVKWVVAWKSLRGGRGLLACGVIGTFAATGWAAEVDLTKLPPPATRPVDFVKDVQPIFANHCYGCHGAKRSEAAFRLDVKEVALAGGELGPAIVPGKSAASLLIHAVSGAKPDLVMPKKGDRPRYLIYNCVIYQIIQICY